MSQASRAETLRGLPRWSEPLTGAAWQPAPFAAPIAGLLDSSAGVFVGPPLLASGPSAGSSGEAALPAWLPSTPSVSPAQPVFGAPVFWPMRFHPPDTGRTPRATQSGPVGAVLAAMIVFVAF